MIAAELSDSDLAVPYGWQSASLRECVDVLDAQRVPVNSDERSKRQGSVPYYGATGQVGWIDDYLFDEELVLLGEDGAPFLEKSKSIAYMVRGKSWVNNHAHVLRAHAGLLSNSFLLHALNVTDYTDFVSGSTRLKLTQREMLSIRVPLPPLAEQRRIVETVEALLSRVAAARARLIRTTAALKHLRQAVLVAGCSGALTIEWRSNESRRVNRESRPANRDALPIVNSDGNLPTGWRGVSLGDVATVALGGTPSRKQPSYWTGAIKWVSSGEVANCRIQTTRESLSQEGLENSNAKLYPRGTVLIAMIGEGKTRGQSAILDVEACTNQNVAGVICDRTMVDPEFVWRWALKEYETTRDVGRGGNQPALNGAKVRALEFPLPPLDEQHEIVRRIEDLTRVASVIERRVSDSLHRVNALPQTILAKAFAGELVPAEAELARMENRDNESAAALIKRTRRELPSKGGVKKPRPQRR